MSSPSKCTIDIDSAAWKKLIASGADEFGIDVSSNQMTQLVRFARILCEWNKKINLTAITDSEEVAIKHVIDSMAVLPFLPRDERLLDIGSGGGFPGIVLAVLRPDLRITTIDAVRKKISFQQHVIRTLGLKRVKALHVRAESLASDGSTSETDGYDIIVSRALGTLELFLGLALPLLAPGGTIIAYKGAMTETEKDEFDSCRSGELSLAVSIHEYNLPKSGDRRTLFFIKPV